MTIYNTAPVILILAIGFVHPSGFAYKLSPQAFGYCFPTRDLATNSAEETSPPELPQPQRRSQRRPAEFSEKGPSNGFGVSRLS